MSRAAERWPSAAPLAGVGSETSDGTRHVPDKISDHPGQSEPCIDLLHAGAVDRVAVDRQPTCSVSGIRHSSLMGRAIAHGVRNLFALAAIWIQRRSTYYSP